MPPVQHKFNFRNLQICMEKAASASNFFFGEAFEYLKRFYCALMKPEFKFLTSGWLARWNGFHAEFQWFFFFFLPEPEILLTQKRRRDCLIRNKWNLKKEFNRFFDVLFTQISRRVRSEPDCRLTKSMRSSDTKKEKKNLRKINVERVQDNKKVIRRQPSRKDGMPATKDKRACESLVA